MHNKHKFIALSLCILLYTSFTYLLAYHMFLKEAPLTEGVCMLLALGSIVHIFLDVYLLRLLYLYTKFALLSSTTLSFKDWCRKNGIDF